MTGLDLELFRVSFGACFLINQVIDTLKLQTLPHIVFLLQPKSLPFAHLNGILGAVA